MENKINIAQLLKEQGVPSGTEFYTIPFGIVKFHSIDDFEHINYTNEFIFDGSLDKYGCLCKEGECILFPSKDQRDWSKYKYEKPEPTIDELVDKYLVSEFGISDIITVFPIKLQVIIKMLAVADYLNKGWKPDWSDADDLKYNIYFECDTINYKYDMHCRCNVCYFKTRELAQKAIEMLGEETIKTALG